MSAPATARRWTRRRWPWILGTAVLLIGAVVLVGLLTRNQAHQVSMPQAEAQAGLPPAGSPASGRPAAGVYQYRGSGTEKLSLPPLTQGEGPTIPGTVSWQGSDCWTFRLDYSSHHWQTWRFCRHGSDLWEAGGQSWQLWAVGPIDFTNLSTFTCAAGSMAYPGHGRVGETWQSRCTGTNSSVKGQTVTAGPYEWMGTTAIEVSGVRTPVVHFHRSRVDTGAQSGTESADVWVDARTGLPVRLSQQLRVTTSTLFGKSTYTQVGTLELASPTVHHTGT